MDRFGPRADRGNNIIGTKVAEVIGGKIPDSRMLNDKVISFMGIGGSDWGTRVQCEHAMLALIPMWKVIDNAWFPWAKELVMDDTRLVQVHQIGLNIVEAAKDFEKASYQGEEGVCPHCHNRLFYLEPGTKKAICALCGIVGELDTISGKTIFSFPEEQLGHAHDTLPGKFIHGDDIKKMEGHYAEVRKTQEFKERKTSYNFIEPLTKEKQAGVSLG